MDKKTLKFYKMVVGPRGLRVHIDKMPRIRKQEVVASGSRRIKRIIFASAMKLRFRAGKRLKYKKFHNRYFSAHGLYSARGT